MMMKVGMYSGNELRTILLSFSLVLNHNSMGKLPMAIDLSKLFPIIYYFNRFGIRS